MEKQVTEFVANFTEWLVIKEGKNAINVLQDRLELKQQLRNFIKANENVITKLAQSEQAQEMLMKSVYQSVNSPRLKTADYKKAELKRL